MEPVFNIDGNKGKNMVFVKFPLGLVARLALVVVSPIAVSNTPEQIFARVSPSVVVVDMADATGKSIGLGSGVVIGVGQVITNCHVAQKGEILQVRHSGKVFKATLQFADPDRDLCQLSAPDLQVPPIVLGTAKKLKVGQRVYAIGAPQGLELTLSEGLVSSLRPYDGSQYIQTSAAISPGSSGGGLFDDQGRLIGITTFYLAEGQSLNFALPVDWIGELPKRAQIVTGDAKKGGLAWVNRVIVLERNEDWRGMLDLAQQWIKSERESVLAWTSLGSAYLNLKQHDQAITALKEALRYPPEISTTWVVMAFAYSDLKEHEQAIRAFREALRLQPDDAALWLFLGSSYVDLGKHDQAIEAFKEVLRIQPENVTAWDALSFTYVDIEQYDEAINAYRELLRIRPEIAMYWHGLGNAYVKAKKRGHAIKAYREALRIQPEYAEAWWGLGMAYYLQGEHDKAREIYQTLRKLDSTMADKYFNALFLP